MLKKVNEEKIYSFLYQYNIKFLTLEDVKNYFLDVLCLNPLLSQLINEYPEIIRIFLDDKDIPKEIKNKLIRDIRFIEEELFIINPKIDFETLYSFYKQRKGYYSNTFFRLYFLQKEKLEEKDKKFLFEVANDKFYFVIEELIRRKLITVEEILENIKRTKITSNLITRIKFSYDLFNDEEDLYYSISSLAFGNEMNSIFLFYNITNKDLLANMLLLNGNSRFIKYSLKNDDLKNTSLSIRELIFKSSRITELDEIMNLFSEEEIKENYLKYFDFDTILKISKKIKSLKNIKLPYIIKNQKNLSAEITLSLFDSEEDAIEFLKNVKINLDVEMFFNTRELPYLVLKEFFKKFPYELFYLLDSSYTGKEYRKRKIISCLTEDMIVDLVSVKASFIEYVPRYLKTEAVFKAAFEKAPSLIINYSNRKEIPITVLRSILEKRPDYIKYFKNGLGDEDQEIRLLKEILN